LLGLPLVIENTSYEFRQTRLAPGECTPSGSPCVAVMHDRGQVASNVMPGMPMARDIERRPIVRSP